MRIYLRRLTAHDMNKEINITKEVFYNFFDESEKISIVCKNSNLEYEVGMNYGQISRSSDGMPKEFRFDSKIKDAIKSEQGFEEGTIVVIKKMSQNYELEVILKNDKSYDRMSSFFEPNKNHTLIEIDEDNMKVIPTKFKRNRIIFGAPGTGKSFKLNTEKQELVQTEEQYERVTFHPDYTYANFVGTYKPIMVSDIYSDEIDKEDLLILNDKRLNAQEKFDRLKDKFESNKSLSTLPILISMYSDGDFETNEKSNSDVQKIHGKKLRQYVKLLKNNNADCNISYEYVPGPFMRLFVKAKKNPNTPYLLLIEEINRANVAAVFGDLFQLLDRDDNEESMYPVEASEDIKKFLLKEGIELENNKLKIPNNLFIWATMNSADQGVFPMDTAFKRRWDFDYIGINNNEDSIKDKEFIIDIENKNGKIVGSPLNWNLIRKSINKYLSENKINEDKQLGAYFISKKILNSNNDKDFIDTFKNKVLMYLFEDAAKQKRTDIFAGALSKGYDSNRYSSICECFDEYGIECFNTSIQKDYIEKIAEKGYN